MVPELPGRYATLSTCPRSLRAFMHFYRLCGQPWNFSCVVCCTGPERAEHTSTCIVAMSLPAVLLLKFR